MTKTTKKHLITLPRREFLMRGGAGILGTIVAAGTANIVGAQAVTAENVRSNLSALRMGDFNPSYASQWAYRLAQALGYLEEVGIDELEVILTEEYVAGLVGGSLDIVHGDTSALVSAAVASGLPIKMVSIHRDSEWWIMGVRAGIETVEDLRGGTITGGPLGGRNTWVMKQVLTRLGLNPETDVTFVPTSGGSDARIGALINSTVDAASVFPRHEAPLAESGGKFLFREIVSAPQEAFGVMGGDWLVENEAAVQAWVLADVKARMFLHDPANREQAYQIMIDYGYEITENQKSLYEVEIQQLSRDGGFESAELMDSFMLELVETGDVPAGIDWRDYWDLKYLWAAQDALGLPRRPASA